MTTQQIARPAALLSSRLNRAGFYAVEVVRDHPEVHVNLTGTNRAIVQIVLNAEGKRVYHGHIEVKGKFERLFTGLNHPDLLALLRRY